MQSFTSISRGRIVPKNLTFSKIVDFFVRHWDWSILKTVVSGVIPKKCLHHDDIPPSKPRSLADGLNVMVHFYALRLLPLGDVTMMAAIRVTVHQNDPFPLFLVFVFVFLHSLNLCFVFITCNLLVASLLFYCSNPTLAHSSDPLRDSSLLCSPQRTLWHLWSCQHLCSKCHQSRTHNRPTLSYLPAQDTFCPTNPLCPTQDTLILLSSSRIAKSFGFLNSWLSNL